MKRILVVDDESTIRELLVDLLSDEGYEVIAANNGERALDVLHREHPELVIMDIMMPGINGRDVLRHMSESKDLTGIPVIIMSAAIRLDSLNGLQAEFLAKPFDLDDLLQYVDRLLNRTTRH